MTRPILTAALLSLPMAAAAQDPALGWPVECTLGEDCFLQNYVDADPGPGAADFTCGPQSYEGHQGTDIALRSNAAMDAGVEVRAAAAGIVLGLRDGEPDSAQGRPGVPDVAGRECGNGVLIDHGNGWQTQYCHMASGSLVVREGQQVAAGDPLGRIGLSGNTEFPHLHLTVRRDGVVVDPFAPLAEGACGEAGEPLWLDPVGYDPGGLVSAGVATAVPDFVAVKDGTARDVPGRGEPLVLWAQVHGGRTGDVLVLRVAGPDGEGLVDHSELLERDQARLFRAAGLRAPEGGWAPGRYEGTATLTRDGTELERRPIAFEIAP
ncbi:M23 family metallopeptidase [Wenxinia saemankumensis]|uniref:Peptidase family M23 n=1 Tax=Wenxinia saemankumensis TaxID=1447782 RepID=A0A1M6BU35_9RHOB|nr:M23 family metallopeptidase [Wenxinia saemankumensis]SHI52207.1 Peptidase family M23 [Wenxinia saemankumensis]